MVQFYLIPSWFFGFGLFLEILFGAITLAVALYSFRIYRYCELRECRLFGWAFLSLSLSYFIWAFVSWYVPAFIGASEGVISLSGVQSIVLFGVYSHMILFMMGIVTLAYMTLGAQSQKTYVLLASLSLIAVLFSENKIVSFYFISSLLLLYVLGHNLAGKIRTKDLTNIFTILAFIFLLFGTIDFTFSAVHHINYVAGHVFYLIGYMFLLANFVFMFLRLRKR